MEAFVVFMKSNGFHAFLASKGPLGATWQAMRRSGTSQKAFQKEREKDLKNNSLEMLLKTKDMTSNDNQRFRKSENTPTKMKTKAKNENRSQRRNLNLLKFSLNGMFMKYRDFSTNSFSNPFLLTVLLIKA